MTQFLKSEERPDGYCLEDILIVLRADIIKRTNLITMDTRPEAMRVLSNNTKILQSLDECIELAMDSTKTLDKAFGPSMTLKGGKPRIGESDAA